MTKRKSFQLDALTKLVTEPYQVENVSLSNGHGKYWHLRGLTNKRYSLNRNDSIYVVVRGYTNEDFNFYQEDNRVEEIKTIVQRTGYKVANLADGDVNAKEICNTYLREHPNYDVLSVKIARKTGTTINP